MVLALPYIIFPFPDELFPDELEKDHNMKSNIEKIMNVILKTFQKNKLEQVEPTDIEQVEPIDIEQVEPTHIEPVELTHVMSNLESNIKKIMNVILKTFQKNKPEPIEISEPIEKTDTIAINKNFKERNVKEYSPDYTADECMKQLSESPEFASIAKYYEPTNTYEDDTTNTKMCMFKLKSITKKQKENMKEDEQEIIKNLKYTITLIREII